MAEFKYPISLPGVASERVTVKLMADRKTITIYVDGTSNKVLTPPSECLPISQQDITVEMSHGLCMIIVKKADVLLQNDEVFIPVNGQHFLQEVKE